MQEILDLVFGYLRGIWRLRWVSIIVAWLVCIIGWPLVFQMPDVYASSARVFVDTSSMLRPLLRGMTIDTDVKRQINLMIITLLSRPNMEKIVRMTDLDLNAQTPEELQAIVSRVKRTIRFKQKGEHLYEISYYSGDPLLAKRVVQSMLTLFVESTLGASRLDTEAAQRFIDEQIKEYAARLDAASQRLRQFKRKNMGKMPGKTGGVYARMQKALAGIKQVNEEIIETEKRRDELKKQLDNEEPFIADPSSAGLSGPPTPFDSRIQVLTTDLDELSLRYTGRHPDVIWTKRTLRDMYERRDAYILEQSGGKASNNPVYQQLKLLLSQAETKIAQLTARRGNLAQQAELDDSMIDELLQIEIDAKNLNRDQGLNQSRYNTLLQKRDLARMSQDVDERADDVKFKVISPPRAPKKPIGPDRPAFLTGVLVGGIVGGIALAFLLSFFKTVYDNRRTLATATGIPVLGTVSMVWTSGQLFKQRLEKVAFFLVLIALTGAYGIVMAVQVFNKTWL